MTVPQDLFRGSRLKIERANKHIRELIDMLAAFGQSDFYRMAVNHDSAAKEYSLEFKVILPIPDMIDLVIGDAAHNLRTALDFMGAEIVRRSGGETKYVKLPFRQTRQDVIAGLQGGEMKVASPSVIETIADVVRPYKDAGGNLPLCLLHDLDIRDKHLLLTTTISMAGSVNIDAGPIVLNNSGFDARKVGVTRVITMPFPFQFKTHGKPTFDILFGEGPFESRPVVPTLHQLSQLVTGAVDAVEKAFVASL